MQKAIETDQLINDKGTLVEKNKHSPEIGNIEIELGTASYSTTDDIVSVLLPKASKKNAANLKEALQNLRVKLEKMGDVDLFVDIVAQLHSTGRDQKTTGIMVKMSDDKIADFMLDVLGSSEASKKVGTEAQSKPPLLAQKSHLELLFDEPAAKDATSPEPLPKDAKLPKPAPRAEGIDLLGPMLGPDPKFDDLRLKLATEELTSSSAYKSADESEQTRMVDQLKAQHTLNNAKRNLAKHLQQLADPATMAKLPDNMQSISIDANLTNALRSISDSDKPLDKAADILIAQVRIAQDALAQLSEPEAKHPIDDLDDATLAMYENALGHLKLAADALSVAKGVDYGEPSLNGLGAKISTNIAPIFNEVLELNLTEEQVRSTPFTQTQYDKVVSFLEEQVNSSPTKLAVRHARQEIGVLADFGISKETADGLLTKSEIDAIKQRIDNSSEPTDKDTEIQKAQIKVIQELAKSKLPSVQSSTSMVNQVNTMAASLTGNHDQLKTTAVKGFLKAQSNYSPEVNATRFEMNVRQVITGKDTLEISDDAFLTAAKEKTGDVNTAAKNKFNKAVANVQRLESMITDLSTVPENETDTAKTQREKQLNTTLKDYDKARGEWRTAFNAYFKNAGDVHLLVQSAVLQARPKGTPLKDFQPTEHMEEIAKTLEGYGLELADVGPLILNAIATDFDRSKIDQWYAGMTQVVPQKSLARDAKQQTAELLMAQAKEMNSGGWVFLSSSSAGGQALSVDATILFAAVHGSESSSHGKTAEIMVSKTDDGYSLTVYAGNGKSFSGSVGGGVAAKGDVGVSSLKAGALFKTTGSHSDSKFSGFTISFANKDGKDAEAGLARFLTALTGGKQLEKPDIALVDQISTFNQSASTNGVSFTLEASGSAGVGVGPLNISTSGGFGAGTAFSFMTKTKTTETPGTSTTSLLTMAKFSRDANGNLGFAASLADAKDTGDEITVDVSVNSGKGGGGTGGSSGASVKGSVGKAIKKERAGVVYGSSSVSQNSVSKGYTAASFGFTASTSNPDKPWETMKALGKLAGCEDQVESWLKDDASDEIKEFRKKFEETFKKAVSGSDYISLQMEVKPDILNQANNLVKEGKPEAAKALLEDRRNYRPTALTVNPTQEWSASTSTTLGQLDIGATLPSPGTSFGVSGSVSASKSGWGELALPQEVKLPPYDD
ncbi:MAG: hypothetical protein AAFN17_07255 [Pseudomonadota bacterium]